MSPNRFFCFQKSMTANPRTDYWWSMFTDVSQSLLQAVSSSEVSKLTRLFREDTGFAELMDWKGGPGPLPSRRLRYLMEGVSQRRGGSLTLRMKAGIFPSLHSLPLRKTAATRGKCWKLPQNREWHDGWQKVNDELMEKNRWTVQMLSVIIEHATCFVLQLDYSYFEPILARLGANYCYNVPSLPRFKLLAGQINTIQFS